MRVKRVNESEDFALLGCIRSQPSAPDFGVIHYLQEDPDRWMGSAESNVPADVLANLQTAHPELYRWEYELVDDVLDQWERGTTLQVTSEPCGYIIREICDRCFQTPPCFLVCNKLTLALIDMDLVGLAAKFGIRLVPHSDIPFGTIIGTYTDNICLYTSRTGPIISAAIVVHSPERLLTFKVPLL